MYPFTFSRIFYTRKNVFISAGLISTDLIHQQILLNARKVFSISFKRNLKTFEIKLSTGIIRKVSMHIFTQTYSM